jgi:hypothetical protein
MAELGERRFAGLQRHCQMVRIFVGLAGAIIFGGSTVCQRHKRDKQSADIMSACSSSR